MFAHYLTLSGPKMNLMEYNIMLLHRYPETYIFIEKPRINYYNTPLRIHKYIYMICNIGIRFIIEQ